MAMVTVHTRSLIPVSTHSSLFSFPARARTRARAWLRIGKTGFLSDSCSMESDGSWHSLVLDPQLLILSLLKQWKDRDSMQAMMQTSRDLRLLASSLISSIEIHDAFALAQYPRHAAAITSMRLCISPSPEEGPMEPCCMVTWLQSTSAISNRLAAVTSVWVELPQPCEEETMEPAVMDNLLASIARACPSLRCLRMDGIYRVDEDDEDLVRAMFTAIGEYLPGIVELQLELGAESDDFNFNIAGIDWADCLPRGLQKFSSNVHLHHTLLQQLVLMPALAEVVVWSLGDEDDNTEVQSGGCAWRVLRIGGHDVGFPSYKSLGRFSAAMPLLHLYSDDPVYWTLDATSHTEGNAVAKAVAWLSEISNCPKAISISWGYGRTPDAASTAGIISALTPLSGLVSLELSHWPVTERALDELAEALPNVCKLALKSCSISSGAWDRMLSLTSVTDLTITWKSFMGDTVPLAQIIAFTSAISRPMALHFNGGSVSKADRAGWEASKEYLGEQRRDLGLPQLTVHIG